MKLFRRDPDRPAPKHPRLRRFLLIAAAAVTLPAATGAFALAAFPQAPPVTRAVAWMFGAEYLGRDGVVMQRGESDCGIAALQMVLAARGVAAATLDSARAAVLARGGRGASMAELKALADARGVPAEGWHLSLRGLAHAPMPALVHLGDHYAVADRVLRDGRVELRDPSLGRLRISAEDFQDIWTGNVLLFPRAARRPSAPAAAAAPEAP